jgi:transposase-like protein
MTPAKLRLAQAAMTKRDTNVGDLCRELGVSRQTLYRHVGPKGELRDDGKKLLQRKTGRPRSGDQHTSA